MNKYPLVSKIHEIASEIGNKFLNIHEVERICFLERNFIPYISAPPWDPTTTSHGYPSIIFLFSALDTVFPDQGWDEASYIMITQLIDSIKHKGVYNSSVFSGLPGISFSILSASRGKTRYQTLLKDLNDLLIKRIKIEYLIPWDECVECKKFIPPRLWDVVTGLSGVLSYLFYFLEDPKIRHLCCEIVDRLSHLSYSNLELHGLSLPAFFTPSSLLLRKDNQERCQLGCVDTGVAHGIAGVLSVLSKAYLLNLLPKTSKKAITRISDYFVDHLCPSFLGQKDVWPSRLVLPYSGSNKLISIDKKYRDGWCYGSIGIARSLFLASKAIQDKNLQHLSFQVFRHALERFPMYSDLKCPSFCHGLSAFLSISYMMFLDTKEKAFLSASKQASEIIIDLYNPSHPFGFKTLGSQGDDPDLWIDNPGILDGTTGIVLSLLFCCSSTKPIWPDLFAL